MQSKIQIKKEIVTSYSSFTLKAIIRQSDDRLERETRVTSNNFFLYLYIYIYIYTYKQLMVASGQQRMPLRQEDQRFTV